MRRLPKLTWGSLSNSTSILHRPIHVNQQKMQKKKKVKLMKMRTSTTENSNKSATKPTLWTWSIGSLTSKKSSKSATSTILSKKSFNCSRLCQKMAPNRGACLQSFTVRMLRKTMQSYSIRQSYWSVRKRSGTKSNRRLDARPLSYAPTNFPAPDYSNSSSIGKIRSELVTSRRVKGVSLCHPKAPAQISTDRPWICVKLVVKLWLALAWPRICLSRRRPICLTPTLAKSSTTSRSRWRVSRSLHLSIAASL